MIDSGEGINHILGLEALQENLLADAHLPHLSFWLTASEAGLFTATVFTFATALSGQGVSLVLAE